MSFAPAPQSLIVKICGLSTPDTLDAALLAGADMVGFVFFAKSPRYIGLEMARDLGSRVEGRALKVALSVDASDAELAAIIEALAPDLLQLHGRETLERVAGIKARFGLPVMKAIGIAGAADVARAAEYTPMADWLLFDAKPMPDATRPGGNGVAFDWPLLANLGTGGRPYLLSGGLDAGNIGRALAESGAPGVDVSSGVESAPGRKEPDLIRAFISSARGAAGKATLGVGRKRA